MSLFDKLSSAVKQSKIALMNLSEIEVKVLDATSNEPWGPTTTEMREIAKATHSYSNFPLIMNTIWKRLMEDGKSWRHLYKSLVLLDFLVKMGSEQVIREARVHVLEIQMLTEYQCVEEAGDNGTGVREKSKKLLELIHDDNRIREEREKARENSSKFMAHASSDSRSFSNESNSSNDTWGSSKTSQYDSPSRSANKGPSSIGYDSYQPKKTANATSYSSYAAPVEKKTEGRPRAPSGENIAVEPFTALQSKSKAEPKTTTQSLIDFDFAPVQTQQSKASVAPTFQNNNSSFFPQHQQQQQQQQFQAPANNNAGWADFSSFQSTPQPQQKPAFQQQQQPSFAANAPLFTNPAQQPTQPKPQAFQAPQQSQPKPPTNPNDPWGRTDLFDFGTSSSSSASATPKVTLGSLVAKQPAAGNTAPYYGAQQQSFFN
eukprot:TRINITY_DN3094_c0_g1_i1.p1 TRINITY_DN3094_c0_g1~~TRINITY_DN3094_c0_g1_i1.p1  ORF type:complete len:431 (+),score=152.13 TRINITY_DN3094_c0_g1_i1:846-2138(+)